MDRLFSSLYVHLCVRHILQWTYEKCTETKNPQLFWNQSFFCLIISARLRNGTMETVPEMIQWRMKYDWPFDPVLQNEISLVKCTLQYAPTYGQTIFL